MVSVSPDSIGTYQAALTVNCAWSLPMIVPNMQKNGLLGCYTSNCSIKLKISSPFELCNTTRPSHHSNKFITKFVKEYYHQNEMKAKDSGGDQPTVRNDATYSVRNCFC